MPLNALLSLNDGAIFAGFRIMRLLGSGGMGEVYLAQHPRLPELPGRGPVIAFGVVGLIAGILVLALPFVSLAALALVVGLCLVITGVAEIVSSFGIRKSAKTVEA